jgi:hypothetical protein
MSSTPKKVFFCLLAILIPLIIIEATCYGIVRVFFPQAYRESKKSSHDTAQVFRQDYRKNDFSEEKYDYTKDFWGPHLQDNLLKPPARLIGPRAYEHYLRVDYYTLFPFTMFHFQRNYRSAIVNTNNLGFRARELSYYEQDPRPKILILGGSAVFGTNLTSDDKTISAQLELYLQRHGKDVACINLAMGGYTSEQEMINLSRIGVRLKPSMVIAIDGYNDVVHYARHRDLPNLFPRLADLFYKGIPPNVPPANYFRALVKHWGRHSSFFCLAGALSAKPSSPYAPDPYTPIIDPCVLFPHRSDQQAIIDNFINSHSVMFDLCKSRNIKYIVGLQPVCGIWLEPRWDGEKTQSLQENKEFVSTYTLFDEQLQALAQKEGFPYLNFGKILAKKENKYNFSDVVHLTDMSAQIIAEKLGEIIIKYF